MTALTPDDLERVKRILVVMLCMVGGPAWADEEQECSEIGKTWQNGKCWVAPPVPGYLGLSVEEWGFTALRREAHKLQIGPIPLDLAVTVGPLLPPGPASQPNWHLLTQSYGGTVSINGGLTKDQCDFAKHRALGEPATPDEIAAQAEKDDVANQKNAERAKAAEEWRERFARRNNCDWVRYNYDPLSGKIGSKKAWGGWHFQGKSYVSDDGMCDEGDDAPGGGNISIGVQQGSAPGDIRTAECFQ